MQFIIIYSCLNNLNHEAFHSGQDVNSWPLGPGVSNEMLPLLGIIGRNL